jgi:5'-3' exonuclease
VGQSERVGSVRKILAVDGNSLVHRAYHAAASSASAVTEPIWAVRGLLTQVVAAVERVGADAIVVGFDDCAASVRRDTWPQYKLHRLDKAQCLVDQLVAAADVMRKLGVAVVVPEGHEADDVLASAAAYAPTVGAETVIMTSDRDSFALINETTSVLRIINGGVEASPLLTAARLPTMLGITGSQYRDFAALRGDPSDNLPGVRGIGPKTAAKLLAALGSAQAAFDDLAAGGTLVVDAIGKGAARLLAAPEARAAWQLNCAVMAMRTDIALGLDASTGAGILPLSPEGVRAAYDSLRLIYSLPTALRVLAGVGELGDEPADEQAAADSARPVGHQQEPSAEYGWARRPQRFPRLAPRQAQPAVQQLSLFA